MHEWVGIALMHPWHCSSHDAIQPTCNYRGGEDEQEPWMFTPCAESSNQNGLECCERGQLWSCGVTLQTPPHELNRYRRVGCELFNGSMYYQGDPLVADTVKTLIWQLLLSVNHMNSCDVWHREVLRT
uniref:Uncharacterized protein n=1 Tax=Physcomitrium patens TaxID=3218 RepID=A0A2K1J4P1_PHYPA|nr:hypothetical protein PHYPA_022345 [Physcomitrium patens]